MDKIGVNDSIGIENLTKNTENMGI